MSYYYIFMAYHISKVSPTLLHFNQYKHYLTRCNVISIVSSGQIGPTYYVGQIHSGCISIKEGETPSMSID